MQFEIIRDDIITASDIGQLRKAVGWELLTERYSKALTNSYTHFSIKEDGMVIAFARIISDGQLYAFIVDLLVHPKKQKQGIGKILVKHVIEELKKDKIRLVQLTFNADLEAFYKTCGFDIISAGSIKNM